MFQPPAVDRIEVLSRLALRLVLNSCLVALCCQAALGVQPYAPPNAGSSPQVVTSGRLENHAGRAAPAADRGVIIRPPNLSFDPSGELNVRPNIEVRSHAGDAASLPQWVNQTGIDMRAARYGQQQVPLEHANPPSFAPPHLQHEGGDMLLQEPLPLEPVFDDLVDETCRECYSCEDCEPQWQGVHPLAGLLHFFLPKCDSGSFDRGVGHERVMHAPFEIITSQPMNNYRFRIDSAYDLSAPDRAEYYWARSVTGRGPRLPERSTDYMDLRMMIESGNNTLSVQTEVPIRIVDPEFNPNHAGLGDISVASKLLLLDGSRWQITQYFKTYFNTGSPLMGLGTGHISMEPGLAYRFRWNDDLYVHGDTTYWFAVGADPTFAGQVLRSTIGLSWLLYETDTTALIPTMEFVSWTVLNGQQTLFDPPLVPPTVTGVDGQHIVNIHPGLRHVWDTGGDLGMFEFGVSAGFSFSKHHWYDSLVRLDLRWSY